ncbi:MAG: hypothetical protein EP332_07215 [Bacteroidetes bacterium]|nr:MAG: hypothetical protein EP332_07215 [Bacteroidota bacterium]
MFVIKKWILAVVLTVSCLSLCAQDKIITVDSDTIECKIMEKGSNEVSYVLYADLSGPARTIKYAQIHKIIMQSGAETEYTALNKPKVRMINGVPEEEVKKQNDEYAYWNRHAFRLDIGASMGNMFSGSGLIADVLPSYSFGLTPRKYLKLTGGMGYGAGYESWRGWNYDVEYYTYNLTLTYRYHWLNKPKLRLFSGLGLGYLLTDAYMLNLQFDPSPFSTDIATEQEILSDFDLYYGIDGIVPDIELIGIEFILGNNWLIGSKLGIGSAGLATIGVGYTF